MGVTLGTWHDNHHIMCVVASIDHNYFLFSILSFSLRTLLFSWKLLLGPLAIEEVISR